MIIEFNLLKDVGYFIYKYKNFCKSINSNRLNPIEWDMDKIEKSFNFQLLEEMSRDEKKIIKKIKESNSLSINLSEEYIQRLVKKNECIR